MAMTELAQHDHTAPAVLTETCDGVLVVRLNRPEARNAVNAQLAEGLAAAMDRLDADPLLHVGVLTGAGTGFCAGMDLKALVRGESPFAGDRGFAGICKRPPSKPLIAAIEGFAVAGGLEIALACDLIVAARGARLGIPEVKRGLVAGAGGLFRLPRRLPHHIAIELAITGDPIAAERAHELGLVNAVCEPGAALDVALGIAARVAANAPLAVFASKELIGSQYGLAEERAWERSDRITTPILGSDDAREGARAFAEKRAPVWKGA
jgi:enoyl-CoA hydratase